MPQNDLAKKVQSLKDKVDKLDKEVHVLKDLLNVQDNWHSETRNWIGDWVEILFGQRTFGGVLRWIDRYTLCVDAETGGTEKGSPTTKKTTIFPKSQVVISREVNHGGT